MLAMGYGKIINTGAPSTVRAPATPFRSAPREADPCAPPRPPASMASLLVPHPQKQAAYNCSKAAVVKMTQTLACEWADRGVIWDNPDLNKLAEVWLSQIPAGRLAKVSDLQTAIVYLASDSSSYMVGHNLVIEGGQSLW